VIYGLEGDDTIYGAGGDDTIVGGEGNDIDEGENGDDSLAGGPGNDILLGGGGQDVLTGGGGRDIFEIGRSAGDFTTITDFQIAVWRNGEHRRWDEPPRPIREYLIDEIFIGQGPEVEVVIVDERFVSGIKSEFTFSIIESGGRELGTITAFVDLFGDAVGWDSPTWAEFASVVPKSFIYQLPFG